MKDKKKSIIDEALMDINAIQEALMSNTKEILRSTMREEINSVVTESLSEANDFEEEDIEDTDVVDTDVDDVDGITADDSAEQDIDDVETDVDDIEADLEDVDADVDSIEGDEVVDALPMGDDMETIDMTASSDEEVISVFKKMNGGDEIEVIGDNSVKIKDPESGNEYFVSMDNATPEMGGLDADMDVDMGVDAEIGGLDTDMDADMGVDAEIGGVDADMDNLDADMGGLDADIDNLDADEDEAIYEVTIEEDVIRGPGHDVKNGSGEVKNSAAPNSGDIEGQKADKDKEITGDNLTGGFVEDEATSGDGHAEHVMSADGKTGPDSKPNAGTSKPAEETVNGSGYQVDTIMEDEEIVEVDEEDKEELDEAIPVGSAQARREPGRNTPIKGAGAKQATQWSPEIKESVKKYNSLLRESKKLKAENENFKKALGKFRTTLTETVVYNSNLTYVTKLFMEHATTKSEKETIMQRFDEEVSTVNESKALYRKIKSEMENKKPITESINKKISGEVKSSAGSLNESTVYADPSTSRIMDLINRVEGRK